MKSGKTILLRVDASECLGLGHLMRCIGLAQRLTVESIRPIFVIKNTPEVHLIAQYGFQFQTLPEQIGFEADALETMEIAAQYDTHIVIADLSYEANIADWANFREYFRMLKNRGAMIVVLDDYNKVDFEVGIQVIPYYGAEKMSYKFSEGTKPLLGLDYFIFREEFARCTLRERAVKVIGKNILVALGGSDPANVTEKVVSFLRKVDIAPLDVRVVIGSGCTRSGLEVVQKQVDDFNKYGSSKKCIVIENARDMAELLLWSDLAIVGGGLIKYEAAVVGTPSIIISQYKIEAERCEEYARSNVAMHLGHFTSFKGDAAATISELLNNYEVRKTMSQKARQLLDGKGAQRIVKHILEKEATLA